MDTKVINLKNGYRIRVKHIESNSNYNKSVNVFKIGEKTPLFGTIFSKDSNTSDIKRWSMDKLYQMGLPNEVILKCENKNIDIHNSNLIKLIEVDGLWGLEVGSKQVIPCAYKNKEDAIGELRYFLDLNSSKPAHLKFLNITTEQTTELYRQMGLND